MRKQNNGRISSRDEFQLTFLENLLKMSIKIGRAIDHIKILLYL